MNVSYFRPRKLGPESVIENTVANQIPHFFTSEANTFGQAVRNRIFSHRSFTALPDIIAERIRLELSLRKLGIGLLSVFKRIACITRFVV